MYTSHFSQPSKKQRFSPSILIFYVRSIIVLIVTITSYSIAMPRQQEIIHKSSPIALPSTGVMKKPSVRTNIFGQLRFFLRAPLSNEKSPLPTICSINPSFRGINHDTNYFIEVINWQSDKVTTTAFVRAGDMVKILIPFGAYKIRYALGNQWYGEKKLFGADKFGSDDMYEMTKPLSSKTAKFEFNAKHPGIDIGAYCFQGNLGKKRVQRSSH